MQKHFLVVYFACTNGSTYTKLQKAIKEFLLGKSVAFTQTASGLTAMSFISDLQIMPGTTNKIREIFADCEVEILYLHHTGSPMHQDDQDLVIFPAHAMSFGVVLKKQTLLDYIFFTRFFFVLKINWLLLENPGNHGLTLVDDYLIMYLQTDKPILESVISFFVRTFEANKLDHICTVI